MQYTDFIPPIFPKIATVALSHRNTCGCFWDLKEHGVRPQCCSDRDEFPVFKCFKAHKFSHADAGQMHLYLNYARAHWMREGENPPLD